MNTKIQELIENTELKMADIFERYELCLHKYRTGRPHPELVTNIKVECYGTLMPMQQLASVNIPEAHQIIIKPYDRNQLASVYQALSKQNLRCTLKKEADLIRLQFPTLTENIRKSIVKDVHTEAESFKVRIRNERRATMQAIKKIAISEGEKAVHEEEVQRLTDDFIAKIQTATAKKEKELTTI